MPALEEGEKEAVFIVHDESTFYCCEGQQMMWMEDGKSKILPKTKGTSIMVSGFICACHGFMSSGNQRSFALFEAGVARDGWFTNKHLVEQFESNVEMFKELHPGCEIIICFDNSMTHHAKAPDALDLSMIKLSDGIAGGSKAEAAYEEAGIVMKDGWYIDSNGTRVVQEMQHPSIDGAKRIQKGFRSILMERGNKHLSPVTGNALPLMCSLCRGEDEGGDGERDPAVEKAAQEKAETKKVKAKASREKKKVAKAEAAKVEEAARVEAARVEAATVEAVREVGMDEAAGGEEAAMVEDRGEDAIDEAARGEVAVVEISSPVEQGKVAARMEAARLKKVRDKQKRDTAKAAKLEAARVLKAAAAEAARLLQAARVEAGEEADAPRLNCCQKCVLSNEPDFLEQKEWLTTVVEAAGFTIMFFPKYHCEFNFIEMIWGWAKSHHRRTCTYNYPDLKERLPKTLTEVMPLAFVRRAARFCLRFMSGYRAGLSGPLLDFTMKKFKSHRTIPLGIIDTVTKQFEEYLTAKALKANK
jgi:hypothetical protein